MLAVASIVTNHATFQIVAFSTLDGRVLSRNLFPSYGTNPFRCTSGYQVTAVLWAIFKSILVICLGTATGL